MTDDIEQRKQKIERELHYNSTIFIIMVCAMIMLLIILVIIALAVKFHLI